MTLSFDKKLHKKEKNVVRENYAENIKLILSCCIYMINKLNLQLTYELTYIKCTYLSAK